MAPSLDLRPIVALALVGGVPACKDEAAVIVPPAVDAAFASVSAGLLHTCAVTVTNNLYCWGWNRDGEIGDGSHTDRVYAVRVSRALSYGNASAGGAHSCAVTTGGAPYCWGLNLTGQLGDGSTASQSLPTAVTGGRTLLGVVSGGTFTCGIASADSSAYCWGWGRYGQLGSRPTETCATSSGSEPCSRTPIAVSGGMRFIAVSAGPLHTCGVATDSTAYCWGGNSAGQLGNGTTADTVKPVAVSGSLKFAAVTLGFSHSCGLTPGGDAYCWGDNTWGQVGDTLQTSVATPVRVVDGHSFLWLSAGATHTCGIETGNTAWCWGQNASGQLGAEAPETCVASPVVSPCSRRPLAVATSERFASISGGTHHTCAVTTSGRAYCWGDNGNGQLGTGNRNDSSVPVLVANQP